jgi:N-acetylmuramoyl-L-alanine amidase
MNLYRRSTAQVAATIADPVERLRFVCGHVAARARRRELARRWFLLLALISITTATLVPKGPRAVVMPKAIPIPRVADVRAIPNVWLVEKTADSETWSNGLRIDNHFLVTTRPRSYLAFPSDGNSPVRRTAPAGIVFHTTESSQAPFEESENQELKRIGESLLEYVRRREAYNFVVDRFGRVFRVVPEEETAHHAGYSAWADANWFYINLNESFLGVSFEAASPGGLAPAQVNSARVLVEMLRHRFEIPASNCVTHAQVSVNSSNMLAGLHVDWAAGFPFEAVGLTDNYPVPSPLVWGLGFDYDAHYKATAGEPLRAAIDDAEVILTAKAAAAGVSTAAYKERLRASYREMLAQARGGRVLTAYRERSENRSRLRSSP